MTNEVNKLYEFANFRFDGGKHELRQNGKSVFLSPKASELLGFLLERQGGFVSKEEIFEKVWSETFVEDGVLTQNIYTLRKILGNGADGKPLIENRAKLGYRITVPIQSLQKSNENLALHNGKEILLATQTRIITEEIVEEDAPKLLAGKRAGNWQKIAIGFAAIAVIVALFGYLFWRSERKTALENLRFQKVTDTGDVTITALSPDGNLAAFVKKGKVFVKDLKTSVETKLEIKNLDGLGFLQFSKDSEFIYLRNQSSPFTPSKIVKVSRYGGEALDVAENIWSNFSLSPDEKQIAFMRRFLSENRQSLFVKNLESGEEKELLTLSQPQQFGLNFFPAWSPDGKKVVANIQLQPEQFVKLVVVEIESGKAEDIKIKDFEEVEQVVWLPKRNALVAVARAGNNFQLWEIGYADKQARRITNDINNYHSLTISADGTKFLTTQRVFFSNLWLIDEENAEFQKQITVGTSNLVGYNGIDFYANGDIVYAESPSDSKEINLWRINPNDGLRRQLTIGAGSQNRNPCVSPDDKFVYFSSNRGGKAHIWRIEANGENPSQMTFSENSAEMFPKISRDSEFLYFIRKDKEASAVWRKSLTANTEERVTDEKQFSPSNVLEISPDGKYLAFQNLTKQSDGKGTDQIAVLEIANPNNVKFFNDPYNKVEVFWTNDSTAFDYLATIGEKDEIHRISLAENTEEKTIRQFPKERLFNLARAKDGKTIVVARGQRQHDAVLLTNFE